MRVLPLAVLSVVAAVSAAVAQPQSPQSQSPQPRTSAPATLCLDGNGGSHPPVCHSQSASRIAAPPDICLCQGPYRRVDAPWCAKGETPPQDTAAFEQARAKAALDSSLFGDTYQGKRMCVPLEGGAG